MGLLDVVLEVLDSRVERVVVIPMDDDEINSATAA